MWFCLSSISIIIIVVSFPKDSSAAIAWGKGFPAVSMDYKVKIPPRTDFCFFQHVEEDSLFYMEFQVIRGADRHASFIIKDPKEEIVFPYEWKSRASYNTEKSVGGYYSICIHNTYSRFDEIVVSIFMSAYGNEGWEKYNLELETLDVSAKLCANILGATEGRMTLLLQLLHSAKSSEARDYDILLNNNYNVVFWSIVQCCIIIASAAVNVYFIRKLFQEKPSSGKYQAKL